MRTGSSKQKSESVTGSRLSNNNTRGASRNVNNLLAFQRHILINGRAQIGAMLCE